MSLLSPLQNNVSATFVSEGRELHVSGDIDVMEEYPIILAYFATKRKFYSIESATAVVLAAFFAKTW